MVRSSNATWRHLQIRCMWAGNTQVGRRTYWVLAPCDGPVPKQVLWSVRRIVAHGQHLHLPPFFFPHVVVDFIDIRSNTPPCQSLGLWLVCLFALSPIPSPSCAWTLEKWVEFGTFEVSPYEWLHRVPTIPPNHGAASLICLARISWQNCLFCTCLSFAPDVYSFENDSNTTTVWLYPESSGRRNLHILYTMSSFSSPVSVLLVHPISNIKGASLSTIAQHLCIK